jgi:hypothetical protein
MKQISMAAFKNYFLPSLMLGGIVFLVVRFRFFVLTNLIEPVAALCWTFWRVISGMDQKILWMFLIFSCSILVINFVFSESKKTFRSAYRDKPKPPDRVAYWQTLITNASLGGLEFESLRNDLKMLYLATIGVQADSIDFEEDSADAQTLSPGKAPQFLFPPKGKKRPFYTRHRLNANLFVPKWLRRWTRRLSRRDYILIDEVLRWMETETNTLSPAPDLQERRESHNVNKSGELG